MEIQKYVKKVIIMENKQISSFSAILLIITIIINHIILNLPKSILKSSSSFSPINIIYISILAILLTLLICKLFGKFPGSDILDVSEILWGKYFKLFIGILCIIYLLFASGMILREFCEGLKIIYYMKTPIYFVIAVFIIVTALTNITGENSIIRSNVIILPIVLISILFIFIANIKNFIPQRIFPLLGDGMESTFISGISNLYAFSPFPLIYFIGPFLKDSSKLTKVSIISIVVASIYLIFSIFSLVFMFSYISSENEIMPIYLASRYIELGTFIQRIDAIFLLIWILEVGVYLSVIVMFILRVYKKITNIENSSNLTYAICLLLFSISLIPKGLADIDFFNDTIYKYSILYFVIIVGLLILVMANIKKKLQEKKKNQGGKNIEFQDDVNI